jgi:hypothetical protein
VCFGFKIYKWVDILFSLRNSRNFGNSFSLRGIFHNLEHKKNGSLIWITKVHLKTHPKLYIDDWECPIKNTENRINFNFPSQSGLMCSFHIMIWRFWTFGP